MTKRSTVKHRYHESNISLSFLRNLPALNKALVCNQVCLPALEQCRVDSALVAADRNTATAVSQLIDREVQRRQTYIEQLKKAITFHELSGITKWRYLIGLKLEPSVVQNLSAKLRLLLSSTARIENIFAALFYLKQISKGAIQTLRVGQPDFMEYILNDFVHNKDNVL